MCTRHSPPIRKLEKTPPGRLLDIVACYLVEESTLAGVVAVKPGRREVCVLAILVAGKAVQNRLRLRGPKSNTEGSAVMQVAISTLRGSLIAVA